MRQPLPLALSALCGSLACTGPHISTVQADALQPRYARPTPAAVASTPLAIVYDPRELPDDVPLTAPTPLPPSTVRHARTLVTQHLRRALETMFERVYVVEDPSLAPPGATTATVHFVEIGLTMSGMLAVGTLEWSLALQRAGDSRPFYSWAERTVGTRGGGGAWGHLDASPLVQGALEASLRALLKDIEARDVVRQVATPADKSTRG